MYVYFFLVKLHCMSISCLNSFPLSCVFVLLCILLFFHSSLFPCSWSVNSIAYRRVIRVYQYEVDDDLSGRFSFHFDSISPSSFPPPPHCLGFFLMHLSLNPPFELCVCSVFCTNPHCDVATRQADGPLGFLILQRPAPLQHCNSVYLVHLFVGSGRVSCTRFRAGNCRLVLCKYIMLKIELTHCFKSHLKGTFKCVLFRVALAVLFVTAVHVHRKHMCTCGLLLNVDKSWKHTIA